MAIVHFSRYSPNGSDFTVMTERITHWYPVDYNGRSGTTIVLDTGKEITVGEHSFNVEKLIAAAQKGEGE